MRLIAEEFVWNTFTPHDRAVLCFLRNGKEEPHAEVLLIEKKRGLGAGKVNAPGGKREPDETVFDTAIRETWEEVGLLPIDPQHRGVLRFVFSSGYQLEVHVFLSYRWTGTLRETEEAKPFWMNEREIPFHRMWEDDQRWLPSVLDGHIVDGEMFFDGDRMITWDIRFCDSTRVVGDQEL